MTNQSFVPAVALLSVLCAGCGSPKTEESATAPSPPPSYRVLVTNENSGDVTIVDGDKLQVMTTVAVGKRPRGITASPDGRTVYVALSGSPPAPPGVDESTLPPPDKSADGIGVIDAAANRLVRTIHAGSDPEQFDLSKDGTLLFVSNEDVGQASVVDLASAKVLGSVEVGEEPEGVRTSPDGSFFYVTSEDDGTVTAVDVASRKAIKTVKVGRRPRSIAFLPDGSRAYVTNENDASVSLLDSRKHTVIQTIALGEKGVTKPMCVILSPGAKYAYVSSGRGKKVFALDTATNQVAGEFEVGRRPWGIAVSPDGKTLFAADGPANELVVVDLATRAVTKRIKAGGSPWGVIVLPR